MSPDGKPERATSYRVGALVRDALKYRYLGNWIDREKKKFRKCFLHPSLLDMHRRADRVLK